MVLFGSFLAAQPARYIHDKKENGHKCTHCPKILCILRCHLSIGLLEFLWLACLTDTKLTALKNSSSSLSLLSPPLSILSLPSRV